MGIHEFNKFLESLGKPVGEIWDGRYVKGKTIAVDTMGIVKAYAYNATKTTVDSNHEETYIVNEPAREIVFYHFMQAINDFITYFHSKGAKLIFVFDGPSPIEKELCKKDRVNQRQRSKDRLAFLRENIKYVNTFDSSYKGFLQEIRDKVIELGYISDDQIKMMRKIIELRGIKCLDSTTEGEKLCCMLVHDKFADIVLSKDTDCHAMGCPEVITKQEIWRDRLYIVKRDLILQASELSYESLLDLCIMMGTDFNNNMPKIGRVGSTKLIYQYRSIDNLPKDNPIHVLNHLRTRQLLGYEPARSICLQDPGYLPKADFQMLSYYLNDIGQQVLEKSILESENRIKFVQYQKKQDYGKMMNVQPCEFYIIE